MVKKLLYYEYQAILTGYFIAKRPSHSVIHRLRVLLLETCKKRTNHKKSFPFTHY